MGLVTLPSLLAPRLARTCGLVIAGALLGGDDGILLGHLCKAFRGRVPFREGAGPEPSGCWPVQGMERVALRIDSWASEVEVDAVLQLAAKHDVVVDRFLPQHRLHVRWYGLPWRFPVGLG